MTFFVCLYNNSLKKGISLNNALFGIAATIIESTNNGPISANMLYISNMLYIGTESGKFFAIYDNPNNNKGQRAQQHPRILL